MKHRLCNCRMCRMGRKHKGNGDLVAKHKRTARRTSRTELRKYVKA